MNRSGKYQNWFSFVAHLWWHVSHSHGFSPVCDLMWRPKLLLVVKRCSHLVQAKGFSPVCIRRWTVKNKKYISVKITVDCLFYAQALIKKNLSSEGHCPKIQLWFPEKNCRFFLGEKLVKMLWFWAFWLLTTLISREKLLKKIWVKNSWKCWSFVKIEFLDKNLTFRIVWHRQKYPV